jgi:hypothetical protein
MATGRDAVDVALTTQFGPGWLQSFNVITEEIAEPPRNYNYAGASYARPTAQTFQNYEFGSRSLVASA